jgi:tRNA (guanine-N7-)-methyltransferase
VAKKKLSRFEELKDYTHVIQPLFKEVFKQDFPLKGNWNHNFFRNNNPLVLELGCGKGEYTTGLAKHFPDKNFIGIDIKGARIWKGARQIFDEQIKNAGFLRTRIDLIESFFQENEVSEIWITFPDPQLRKARKRLTAPLFLNRYRKFLLPRGIIHLKTDSRELYEYTLETLRYNQCEIVVHTNDLYSNFLSEDFLTIKNIL